MHASVGSLMWVRDRGSGLWSIGHVLKSSPNEVEVCIDSSRAVLRVLETDTRFANDLAEPVPENLITLRHLNEPAVLHALQTRYASDGVYTFTGNFLTAVNPYKEIPQLYSLERIVRFAQGSEAGPHVFAIANAAFRNMQKKLMDSSSLGLTNQVILISGESGAGKTESAKYIMKFLTQIGTHPALAHQVHAHANTSGSIMDKVMESNPILEAFGNACTVRNRNSSRFGKFIELRFDGSSKLLGADIRTYLLEKVRVTSHAHRERSFHIFYQMCNGASEEERRRWRVLDESQYQSLVQREASMVTRAEDMQQWTNTSNAFQILGLAANIRDQLFSCLSGILHLCNINFKQDSDGSIRLDHKSHKALEDASYLLGLDIHHLRNNMCHQIIRERNGNVITLTLNATQCNGARDAIARALYGRVFDWVVAQVNQGLQVEALTRVEAVIGVLDIFGFENFETNSFEQLCINYSNECLQHHFTSHVLVNEQKEYHAEGLSFDGISFTDNSDVIRLISGKPTGILTLLEDQCKMGDRSDDDFLGQVYKHPSSGFVADDRSLRRSKKFGINHYAGRVDYFVDGFLEKNRDKMPSESENLLQSSNLELLSSLFTSENIAGRKLQQGVGVKFRDSLKSLMDMVTGMAPHYVRCVKPNDSATPGLFNQKRVGEQLHSGGVIAAIQIARSGYPVRFSFRDFAIRYWRILSPKQFPTESDGFKRLSLSILASENHCQKQLAFAVGRTKVFLCSAKYEELERKLMELLEYACVQIQRLVRLFVHRRRSARKLREQVSAIRIQTVFRGFAGRKLAEGIREQLRIKQEEERLREQLTIKQKERDRVLEQHMQDERLRIELARAKEDELRKIEKMVIVQVGVNEFKAEEETEPTISTFDWSPTSEGGLRPQSHDSNRDIVQEICISYTSQLIQRSETEQVLIQLLDMMFKTQPEESTEQHEPDAQPFQALFTDMWHVLQLHNVLFEREFESFRLIVQKYNTQMSKYIETPTRWDVSRSPAEPSLAVILELTNNYLKSRNNFEVIFDEFLHCRGQDDHDTCKAAASTEMQEFLQLCAQHTVQESENLNRLYKTYYLSSDASQNESATPSKRGIGRRLSSLFRSTRNANSSTPRRGTTKSMSSLFKSIKNVGRRRRSRA